MFPSCGWMRQTCGGQGTSSCPARKHVLGSEATCTGGPLPKPVGQFLLGCAYAPMSCHAVRLLDQRMGASCTGVSDDAPTITRRGHMQQGVAAGTGRQTGNGTHTGVLPVAWLCPSSAAALAHEHKQ